MSNEDPTPEAPPAAPEAAPEPKRFKRGKATPEAPPARAGLWKAANAVFLRTDEIDAAAAAGRNIDETQFTYVPEERDGIAGFTMTLEDK